jgi:Spy/CpxP family protein refolding chaperone
MKKVIALSLGLIFLGTLSAQNKSGKKNLSLDERVNQRMEILEKATGGLQAEQKTKLQALNIEKVAQFMEWRKANKGKLDKTNPDVKAAIANYKTSLKAILTAEQKKNLMTYLKTKKASGKAGADDMDINDLSE